LPGLSVDIDLAYLPMADLQHALSEINQSLQAIAEEIAVAQILYLLKTEHLAQHIEYF
jgi:hypothetical protein